MRHLAFGAALLALGLAALPAKADLVDQGYCNGWNVMVDTDLGNGCLIQTARDGKSLTRIGYDAVKKQGYIAVFEPDWTRLREGQAYPLVFDLDGTRYPAVATGLQLGRVHGAGVMFTNTSVFDAIAKAQSLTVFDAKGAPVFQLDLKGTAEALAAARKCQQQES
ncbi:hypothetical protein [Marinibacterium profundimaris]|uniref:Uncharacterized protein n=1 Tax=Marinibacterium profundimaris TaxID=1679460 RepID=A0A225NIS1_9RHOB|nr:hypothetical protein [Marinibacterium profundimaris]OWU73500.1 hypothetical protein ATO3_12630 [Marinibacterium profundimaris]